MQVFDRSAPSFAQLALRLPDGPVHLVGFSLGAACALRLAALAPDKVKRVTLISAAAPLELGDFLPHMAGAAVFRAARSHDRLAALTRVQSVLARMSPGLFARLLINGADPADRSLFRDPAQMAVLKRSLAEGLGDNRDAYLRELAAYVRPWAGHLPRVAAPVTLVHGTADRWAPFAMAEALAQALPDATLRPASGRGHYTTLVDALSRFSA
nr:alpha/beta hydrolase [Thalassococcus arenae]